MAEQFSKVEKFVIAYLKYEYGGSVYFTRGAEEPERFLATYIANELFGEKRPHHYKAVLDALENAIKKLVQNWVIQLSGYEVSLTIFGRQLADSISKEEYQRIREELTKGKL